MEYEEKRRKNKILNCRHERDKYRYYCTLEVKDKSSKRNIKHGAW